jgi:hypothetical protein
MPGVCGKILLTVKLKTGDLVQGVSGTCSETAGFET